MSHYISYKHDGGIWLSNASFAHLLEILVGRAQNHTCTPAEREDFATLEHMWREGMFWAGRCIEMSEDLKELKLPEFWEEQLYALAQDVFLGRAGTEVSMHQKLDLICGSCAWSGFFGIRARAEKSSSMHV